MSQAFCQSMKNHTEDDRTLLGSLFGGLNVYFNYTGTTKCLDVLSSATPSLGEQGWDFQVIAVFKFKLFTKKN